MNIIVWTVLFPSGILLSGFLSSLKPTWPGIIPIGTYSLLFLCLHWLKSIEAQYIGNIFLILSLISVVVYGLCRGVLALISSRKKKIRNSDIQKSKVQDI